MAYYLFFPLDYPASRLYSLPTFATPLTMMLTVGGLQWFCYGFAIQGLLSIRRVADLIRPGIGVLVVGFLWTLPEFALNSLPEWEEHWQRGTAAAEAHNLEKAVRHVSEAIRLSPKDNSMLDGMWDYLGRLQTDQKDYDHAEMAFMNALAVAKEKSNSRPVGVLNAYNQLTWFYGLTGHRLRREECLRKAIELNRVVYGGDSTQEADCWHSLAEIARESGDLAEAQVLIERAIMLESSLPHPDKWSLNYMKRQLREWTDKN